MERRPESICSKIESRILVSGVSRASRRWWRAVEEGAESDVVDVDGVKDSLRSRSRMRAVASEAVRREWLIVKRCACA